jgi:uncharacterized cupin superfamily protein
MRYHGGGFEEWQDASMSEGAKPPALDPLSVPARQGSVYRHPYREQLAGREKRALGDALGLTHFGVNLVALGPGDWSSPRHWHSDEDEFIYVLEGELTLVTDGGEQRLTAGMAAGFPADVEDGHHLINRSDAPARYLEVGTRSPDDVARYPDIDLVGRNSPQGRLFTNRKGEAY